MIKNCEKHGQVPGFLDKRGCLRCKACRVEYVTRARQRQKEKLVAEFGGKCCRCGYSRCIAALEFHHVKPEEKSFGIAGAGSIKAYAVKLEEAMKYILLCAVCHREIEAGLPW